jgi:dihydrofolate synthase/folylpolyglutamate synthase
MYESDLKHPDQSLEDKLYKLYGLNREKTIDLSFRPPYLNLLEKFGNPHLHLPPVIHVAGTNGKGSSIAIMRSVLEEMCLRVHAYTSPHLIKFNERIVLAGSPIGDAALEALVDEAMRLNDGGEVTFFEVTTAMAFAAFSRAEADVVLLETGLGGRLDCTNVVEAPVATLITTISKDHMEYLGDDLPDIAGEKAGIMKAGAPCVVAPQTVEAIDAGVLDVFEERSAEVGSDLVLHGRDWSVEEGDAGFRFVIEEQIFDLPLPALLGAHQVRNAGGVMGVLYSLRERFGWDVEAIDRGLRSVRWGGRLERVEGGTLVDMAGENSEIWYDGGHNDSAGAALAAVAQMWAAQDGKPLYLVVGMKADKAPDDFLMPLMPHCAGLSVVPLYGIGGCLDESGVQAVLQEHADVGFSSYDSVAEAVCALSECHSEHGKRILICGSLYLASQSHV